MFNDIFNQRIGKLVVDLRNAKGISQKSLADRLKFSAQFMGRIEKGVARFPKPSLKRVARILNISPQTVERIAGESALAYAKIVMEGRR